VAEHEARQQLFEAWSQGSEGGSFNNNYRELFLQLEEVLADIMKRDRADGHVRSERGWTPPPKPTATAWIGDYNFCISSRCSRVLCPQRSCSATICKRADIAA